MEITPRQIEALLKFYEAAKVYDEAQDWEQDEEFWGFGTSAVVHDDFCIPMWGALDDIYDAFDYKPMSNRPFTYKDGQLYEFTDDNGPMTEPSEPTSSAVK